jgi:predicted transposase/invertase (TIGR01784 family)
MVPAELSEALDWATLTLQPGSFVDGELRGQHTDLLYAVTRHDGSDVLVYFLFEHQSTVPTGGLMALRLLRYQTQIWERWYADHPEARRLPMITPLVLYHGAAEWSAPLAFDALLDTPAGARPRIDPYLVRFEYVLHDLSRVSDAELRDAAMLTSLAKLVEVCFKYARTHEDFLEILGRWMDVVRDVVAAPNGLRALVQVIRYILEVNDHVRRETLEALVEREIGPQAKEAIVTVGQQLIEEGRKQGLAQGIAQGIEQGIEQERQHARGMLLRFLRQRFGDAVQPHIEQRVATASREQLDLWLSRLMSGTTLEATFAD